jgi:hypothetical protein
MYYYYKTEQADDQEVHSIYDDHDRLIRRCATADEALELLWHSHEIRPDNNKTIGAYRLAQKWPRLLSPILQLFGR